MGSRLVIARYWRHVWSGDRLLAREFNAHTLDVVETQVAEGERRHACELRFAVEGSLDLPELWRGVLARQRALEVFGQLRVWDTEANTGVLLYVLLADHAIEIVADRAVARVVSDAEWQHVIEPMRVAYREGRYLDGTRTAIEALNELLARHFPARAGDADELPNRPVTL